MEKTSGMGPGNRLEMGAAVFAAAQVVDTALIKPRLTAFMAVHRGYVGAQGKVDAADADVHAAQAKLALCDTSLSEAVEALARALVNEGQPRASRSTTWRRACVRPPASAIPSGGAGTRPWRSCGAGRERPKMTGRRVCIRRSSQAG